MRRIAIAGVVGMLAACSREPVGPVNQNKPVQPPMDARSHLAAAAAGRTARGFEDEILRLENAVPGFGGLFKDAQGRVVVYLPTATDRAAALRQLGAAASSLKADNSLRNDLRAGRVLVRDGRFPFSQLVAWQGQVLGLLKGGEGVRGVDADESTNRVRITLLDGTSRNALDQALASSGIPNDAILVDFGNPLFTSSVLTDRFRPTGGGIQIANSTELCTLGFPVTTVTYHETGYLTAAHCSDGGAGNTGGTMYQNTNAAGNQYGTVSLNPAPDRTDAGCMSNPRCAW